MKKLASLLTDERLTDLCPFIVQVNTQGPMSEIFPRENVFVITKML